MAPLTRMRAAQPVVQPAYCMTHPDNYQDVCAKQKEEDLRFIEGVIQLIGDRNIIYRMIHIYFENIFKQKKQHTAK